MFKLRVKSIKKQILQADGSRFFDVEVAILKGKKVVETRKFGFPIDASEKKIRAELKKFIDTYNLDAKQAKNQKEFDKQEIKTDKIVEKLTGATI